MRKRQFIISAIISFCLIFAPFTQKEVFAFDVPYYVRVGLESKYRELGSIAVSNKSILIGYESNGTYSPEATITSTSGFSVIPTNAYYVRLDNLYQDYISVSQAVKEFAETGFVASAGFVSKNNWYVYLGGYDNLSQANEQASLINMPSTVLQPNNRRIALLDEKISIVIFDSEDSFGQIADSNGGVVNLGDRRYRGRMEFGRYNGKNVTAISVVKMDEYLYSVVPSEMPSAWHSEALKAQSTAARTYAVTRMLQNPHNGTGYELCDQGHCQVYLGAGNESESGRIAVDATSEIMIYYNGRPINSVFFSSSGGGTDDSENVWVDEVPYLRGVKELNETTGRVWTRTYTLEQLTKIASGYGAGIGTVTDMQITKRGSTDRVLELTIYGELGTIKLEKEEIRQFFSSGDGGALDSRNFTISSGITSNSNNSNNSDNSDNSDKSISVKGNVLTTTADIKSLYAVSENGESVPVSNTATVIGIGAYGITTEISTEISPKTSPEIFTETFVETSIEIPTETPKPIEVDNISPELLDSTDLADSSDSSDGFTISGSGWGHGVGMSQHGAKGMAEAGYTYKEILQHYYTNVEVE